jgi:hypothetical protein
VNEGYLRIISAWPVFQTGTPRSVTFTVAKYDAVCIITNISGEILSPYSWLSFCLKEHCRTFLCNITAYLLSYTASCTRVLPSSCTRTWRTHTSRDGQCLGKKYFGTSRSTKDIINIDFVVGFGHMHWVKKLENNIVTCYMVTRQVMCGFWI